MSSAGLFSKFTTAITIWMIIHESVSLAVSSHTRLISGPSLAKIEKRRHSNTGTISRLKVFFYSSNSRILR